MCRTRLDRMGRQCWGQAAVALLTTGMVAKDSTGDPKSDTKANLKA